jgi:hypothetical protein
MWDQRSPCGHSDPGAADRVQLTKSSLSAKVFLSLKQGGLACAEAPIRVAMPSAKLSLLNARDILPVPLQAEDNDSPPDPWLGPGLCSNFVKRITTSLHAFY